MASYNPLNNNSAFNSNNNNLNNGGGKSFFSKALRDLSKWGMHYDDMVSKNKVSLGINENPDDNRGGLIYDVYSLTQRSIASLLEKKSIPYLDKSYLEKRKILREYSIKDKIKDFIERICNEAIIYDDDRSFCTPIALPESYSQEIRDAYQNNFESIFHAFGFNDGRYAWDMFKDYIIDGYLAMEIVYDDKDQKIIGFTRIDPASLVPAVDTSTNSDVWIQFPDDPRLRRIILDSKVVFVTYKSQNVYDETSYVEGLIKPYNQLKLLEQTRIMFNLANASIHQVFKIPITGLSRQKAEEELSKLIANYYEHLEFDESTGIATINGSKNIQLNKQYFLPVGESGSTEMTLEKPEGHDLNENDMLTWFYNELKRASKIPFSRFDSDNGGGNVFSDLSEMTRDEATFGLFIKRLRAAFKEVVVKPLKLQMLLDFPELKNNYKFANDMKLEFTSNNLFESWKKINNMLKRIEAANEMAAFKSSETESYFHPDFIVEYVMELSEEEKSLNKAYKQKSKPTGDIGNVGGEGAIETEITPPETPEPEGGETEDITF